MIDKKIFFYNNQFTITIFFHDNHTELSFSTCFVNDKNYRKSDRKQDKK